MYRLERMSLVEMVEKSGRLYANRPALSMVGGMRLSYAELDGKSTEVARMLASRGIRKGDRVAILAENSPHWGAAYFGILKAGATVVPILVDFSAEQIRNILLHSGAVAVFCSDRLFAKISGTGLSIAAFDMLRFEPRTGSPEIRAVSHPSDFTVARPGDDDVAMIIYTSGTTGHSKGVMLTHRNILSNALACRSIIILWRMDRLLSILPLAHAYEFTIGFVIPLLSGSHIHYLDKPPSSSVLLPALKAVRPTIMLSVPLVIEKVYRASVKPALEKIGLYSRPWARPLLIRFAGIKLMKTFGGRMRFFGIGGAPLSQDVEEFLLAARFPYAIGYGLTETAPLLAGCPPHRNVLRSTGPALAGVRLRIADPRPENGEGEIQARGDNVFKGYYMDPVRTAEAFTDDGWFRTGDLGYMDSRGRLFVRGRIKTMILGPAGENIYPEEIEAVLNQSPYVAESLVVEGEAGLTAFVYLKSEVLENIEAIIQDGLDSAGQLSSRLGHAIVNAEKSVADSLGQAFGGAEKAAARLLEAIRKEANMKLNSFSRIHSIELQEAPFEKTPTQKIKRFLYGRKGDEGKDRN
jgi:long-chain acyl-CoA synthetase